MYYALCGVKVSFQTHLAALCLVLVAVFLNSHSVLPTVGYERWSSKEIQPRHHPSPKPHTQLTQKM